MNSKILKQIGFLITVVSFVASFFVLAGFLKNQGLNGIISGFLSIAPNKIAASLFFTALSYFFLIFYDYAAIRYLNLKVPFKKTASVSFTANAFGNSLGLSLLSSSAVRFRLYSLWQVPASKTAQIIVFCEVSSFTGFALLSAFFLNMSIWPSNIPASIKISTMAAGITMLLILVLYLYWSLFSNKTFKAFGYEMNPPRASITLIQICASVLEWFFAAAAFYVLLPFGTIGLKLFIASYMASELLGILSNVPGGLGVFDAAAISLLSLEGSSSGAVISALILYRIIYYLFPLIISYFIYGFAEAEILSKTILKQAGKIKNLLTSTPGYIFSLFVFVSGATTLLLLSFPPLQFRASSLINIMPPLACDIISILCGLSAATLMMLSRGLQKSVVSSHKWSIITLAACSLFLILTGLNFEIAALNVVLIFVMLYYKNHFYRIIGPLAEKPTTGIFFSYIFVITICSVMAWISFLLLPASQNLRGAISLGISAASIAIWMLISIFKPYKPAPHSSSLYTINTASKIAFESPDSMAQLVLLGDKKIIFSWSGASFLMYAQCGDHWVAFGDPYGPYIEAEELIWKFKKLARQNNGTPAFFNVSSDYMHFYEDAGLKFYKIGEQAKIALESYPVDTKKDEKLKKIAAQMQSYKYSFRVLPRGANSELLKNIATVSDVWLKNKRIKEQGFITGFYDNSYLKRFHIAAVYDVNDKLCAFANILSSADRSEFRIDMLRCALGVPDTMEDYMRYKLLLWGMDKHYAFFNLGLSPLASLEFNSYSPSGNSIAAGIYNHGLKYTSASKLRESKEIFSPIWHSRYLVCGSFLDVPSIFSEIGLLTKDKSK